MLKGFAVPLTLQGDSAITRPPSWHYPSDCIAVEYWSDPAAVEALLPPGMVPDAGSNGRCLFWCLDWQFTGSNEELTDPARYQYREAFILAEARFEGIAVNHCPLIFVDRDAAIARGWIQGLAMVLGSVP
ncbi:acetoacetate decarboxylase family protein [Roseomonas sp. HJA6]|uniref:Acetoacetate decarboxylase family protein n=1 Tax=Roseomonas alba TaxID=2846776 RepID=A0ABS7AG88_9PROT|nr:acetoacetate decarboxylase family protein [Neoroseomonas alba]